MGSDFAALPADILIALLAHVDVLDIISVRRTCKSLHALVTERVIWLNMLRKVRAEHSLFYPARTVQAMSAQELENAACGPSKWLSLASKNMMVTSTVSPKISRRIPLFDGHLPTPFIGTPMNPQYFHVHAWHLVPGGEYLVTWSSTSLSVWDLRYNGEFNSSQPMSTVSMSFWEEAPDVPGTTMIVQPTTNGNGLTILTFFHRQQQSEISSERFICKVYGIYMDDKTPALRCVASLTGPKDKEGCPCSMHGDLVAIFVQPRELAVWNYRTDTWTTWSVAGRLFSDVYDIVIQPTYVALLHFDKIAVWPIPPLAKVEDKYAHFQYDSTPVGASATCDVPAQSMRRYRWALPKPWDLGICLPVIGAKTHHKQDMIDFDSFELIVSEDLSTASIAKRLPTVILDQTVARVQLRAEHSSLACVTIFGRNSLRIHPFAASRMQGNSATAHLAKSDVVTIPMSPVYAIPDFCPASGRIAFMQDKDYAGIHVWDLC